MRFRFWGGGQHPATSTGHLQQGRSYGIDQDSNPKNCFPPVLLSLGSLVGRLVVPTTSNVIIFPFT